jgi:hypothetical protein
MIGIPTTFWLTHNMNIDQAGKEALERVNALIEKRAKSARKKIFNMFHPVPEFVPASQHVVDSVVLTLRDTDEFYRAVHWCNRHAGQGSKRWTVRGRVLRFIDPKKKAYNPPAIKEWVFFVPVDIETFKRHTFLMS